MSNFSVNGVSPYSNANLYAYLGSTAINPVRLQEAFDEFNINPTGSVEDLRKLKRELYKEYSQQVQNQIANQNGEESIPWAGVCAQIGVQVTGDKNVDSMAFENAIRLLSMNTMDGNAMAYFAGLRNEASKYFFEGVNQTEQNPEGSITFKAYQAQYLR